MADGNIVVIDAPPGSSCPVVESIKDVDYVLLVTEPTPFGIHDVSIVMNIIKDMGIEGGLVINRKMEEDGFYRDLREMADKKGVKVICEIPLSKEIAQLYTEGKNLYHSSYRKHVERICEEVLS